MRAKRDVTRRLLLLGAVRGLEPLSIAVDERDQRDRCPADLGRELDDLVEDGLRDAVEDLVRVERSLARGFSCRASDHAW